MIQMEFIKEETTKDSLVEFSKAIISGQCSEHLLDTIEKIRSRFPPGQKRSIDAFPKLAGSHLKLDNPALFYAKTVMEMLSAHQEVEEEVRVLRRNLFRILNTSGRFYRLSVWRFIQFLEFSPSAEWIDPGSKLILPDVVCHLCGVTKDVDLGIRINPDCDCSEKEIKANLKTNLNQIERRLIDLIRRKLIGWNIQDVTCIRCNEVRVRDMSNLCECSGKFKVMEDGKSLQTLIRTVRSIAEFYSMNTLKSTMDWILGSTGIEFKTISIF